MAFSNPSQVALEIERILAALTQTEKGSEAALDLIGQAVSEITYFARDHINAAFPELGEVNENNKLEFQRQTTAALRPFLMAYGFFGEVADELLRGFWSLENGDTPPALKATPRPGARLSIQMRELSLRLVSLADFVKNTVDKTEAYKVELRECGLNESSIRAYKKELGLFSTDQVEDPYRAESLLRIANGQPALTLDQKFKLAKDEMRAIKKSIDEHLIIKKSTT